MIKNFFKLFTIPSNYTIIDWLYTIGGVLLLLSCPLLIILIWTDNGFVFKAFLTSLVLLFFISLIVKSQEQ